MRNSLALACVAALIALAALVPVAGFVLIAPLLFAGIAIVAVAARREGDSERCVGTALPALRAITVSRHLARAGLLPVRL